jgi:hypothetical protein
MARLSGPLMSVDASGKFGGAMVFSKWKGRNYARQLVTPKNPRSAKQTGVRALMKFIANRWYYLTAPNKATWDAGALAKQISAYNEYVGNNLFRWQEFKPPTKAFPAAETANAITITTMTLTGGQGFATIAMTPSGAGDNWGYAIFRDTAEITAPNWNNCVAVVPANGATAVSYTDSPLVAGTYHYRCAVFNTDGTLGTIKADATCVVS